MRKFGKIVWYIFLVMTLITILIKFFPDVLEHIPNVIILTGDQVANILTILDIVLASVLAIYSIVVQKHSEWILFDIKIGEDDFSLENYRSYNIGSDEVFAYEHYSENSRSDIPRYGISVEFVENSVCNVCIPLSIGISTNLKGVRIELSDLIVIAKKNGRLIAKKSMDETKLPINGLITSEKTYIVRLQLLCDHDLEAELIDGRIYICFSLTFHEERRQKHKHFVFVKIQNVGGASSCLLDVSRKRNFLAYLYETKRLTAKG